MQEKAEQLLKGEKSNCGPLFMYGIAGKMRTEAPAASHDGVAGRAVVTVWIWALPILKTAATFPMLNSFHVEGFSLLSPDGSMRDSRKGQAVPWELMCWRGTAP